MNLKPARLLLVLSALFWVSALQANIVSLQVSKNITSNAEYLSGDPDKPVLIFIHGYLQTRDFSTVKRLSEALHEEGYSVLSPTLSLGISNRAQSISCESIHLHSLNSDTDEITKWVNWASQQGHKEIVLIGHSAGSVNITAYLAQGAHPAVTKSILISLTHYGPDRPTAFETSEHAKVAKDMLHKADNSLHKFALQFCREYVTTAQNVLSYYNWSSKQVLKAITTSTSKNYIILGSSDDRIGPRWLTELEQVSDMIITIEGANHFFDQAHEFDLVDSIENILSE
ncbi:MAG: alpha/beta hydrolase [Gammaproteobacteria bacterium]|nr:alpha/beta hydrolase [Gammaproteobacteria bacterium]